MYSILIGSLFIIGGLSGSFVMKGTESGLALAGLGVLILIFGIFQMSGSSRKGSRAKTTRSASRSTAVQRRGPRGNEGGRNSAERGGTSRMARSGQGRNPRRRA